MEILKKAKTPALAFLVTAVGLASGILLTKTYAASVSDWENASISSSSLVTAPMLPFRGKGLIDGVMVGSSPATGAFVELRDSSYVVTTAYAIYGATWAPFATVFFSTAGNTSSNGIVSPGAVWTFKPPLRVYNGLSIQASNCQGASVGFCYSVQYRTVEE